MDPTRVARLPGRNPERDFDLGRDLIRREAHSNQDGTREDPIECVGRGPPTQIIDYDGSLSPAQQTRQKEIEALRGSVRNRAGISKRPRYGARSLRSQRPVELRIRG